jgi:DNA-binding ferritin-like protein (Dps family)
MSGFIEKFTGDLGQKKRWRQYRARVAALPEGYRTAVEGFQRYLMYAGSQGLDATVELWEDLADLFEQAAADRTPIHDIVGDDPVAFAAAFSANYGTRDWRSREQRRLGDAIAEADRLTGGNS